MQNNKEIVELLLKHIRQELSGEEIKQLENWAAASAVNQDFLDEISNPSKLMAELQAFEQFRQIDINEAWMKAKALGWEGRVANEQKRKVIQLKVFRYVAAAAIIMSVFIGIQMLLPSRKPAPPAVVQTPLQADVTPKTSHAILTLDNGTTIVLDSIQTGVLATQGNSKVIKDENGVLSYSAGTAGTAGKLIYNTVTVPKGSDVVYLQLADRSKVWLNAGSSIRYPVAFQHDERKVEITGEAYFEVAKEARSFTVLVKNIEVKVLGTHFNVMAYEDEKEIKTTLLEGAIKVTKLSFASGHSDTHREEVRLKPGEQALILMHEPGEIKLNKDPDVEEVIAWKNGLFKFGHTDFKALMRQIARWYDIDIVYEGVITQRTFSGDVSRSVPLSKMLLILKAIDINCRIEGRKLIVK